MHGSHSSYSAAAMVSFESVLLGIGALLIVGPRVIGARAKQRGFALAAAAGVLFGLLDVAVKALTGLLHAHGPLGLVSPWLLVAAVASVKTIETHVSNVLRKLQLTNRNQLTRWAARRRMI